MTDHEKAFFGTEPDANQDTHMAEQSLQEDAMRTKMAKYVIAGIVGAMAGAVGTSAYFITRPLTASESRSNDGTCPPPIKPPEKDLPSQATASIEDAMENPGDISQASAISHPEPATISDDNNNRTSEASMAASPLCPVPADCPEPVICPEQAVQIVCPPPKECTPTACTEPQPVPEKVCPPIPQAQECPSPEVVEKIVRVKVREVVEKKVQVIKEVTRDIVRDPALKRQLGAAYDRIRKLELQNGDLRSKLARERSHRPQNR